MKFCKKCGRMLTDDAEFCTACGAPVGEETPAEAAETPQEFHEVEIVKEEPKPAPVPVPAAPAAPAVQAEAPVSDEQNAAAKNVMVFGIVAAALSELGLPGLILSLIAKRKVRDYEAQYGPATRKAKAGKICATVAFPVSIVMTVFWAIYCLCLLIWIIWFITSAVQNGGASISFH